MNNLTILILNALLYVTILLVYWHRKKKVDFGFVCLLAYSISSAGSVWYYTMPNVDVFYSNISIVALLYLFGLIILCIIPFMKFTVFNVHQIDVNVSLLKIMSLALGICFVPIFLNLVLNLMFKNLGGNVLNSMYESDIDNATNIFIPAVKPFFSLVRRFYDVIVIFFFLNLLMPRNKMKYLLLLLLGMGVISFFLYSFQCGSRGGIVINLIKFIGYAIIFYPSCGYRTQNIIKKTSLVFFCSLILGLFLISSSRFSSQESGDKLISQWISQYLGEGMVRFSDQVWPLEKQLNGNKNFILLKSIIDLDAILDNTKAIQQYSSYLGIPTNVFYTFIGTFYLDFGRAGTILFCVMLFFLLSYIIKLISKRHRINILGIYLLCKFYSLFCMGITSNVYALVSIQTNELFQFILVLIIYLISKDKKNGISISNSNSRV